MTPANASSASHRPGHAAFCSPASSTRLAIAVVALLVLLLTSLGFAQTADRNRPAPRTGDAAESSLNREVAESVTLSPEKIVEILTREPALLLAFKKTLVRKAFEQGRLLDEADLTDNAVFQLIGQDVSVRALATREIETRKYLQVRPTQQEVEASRTARTRRPQEDDIDGDRSDARRSLDNNQRPTTNRTSRDLDAAPSAPSQRDRELDQENRDQDNRDSRSRMLRAEGQSLQEIHPDELPQLLATSTPPSTSRLDRPASRAVQGQLSDSDAEADPDVSRTRVSSSSRAADYDNRRVGRRPNDRWSEQNETTQRPNPYANIPALYDLYSQVSRRNGPPERFGADIFRTGTGNLENLPMDLPVGPEYILGSGDGLIINLSGSISQRLQRAVDREGRVSLPEVGTVLVAGKSLGQVQETVQQVLRTEFRDVQADVSLSRLRSVRAYVVGDVEHPGAYDISSLSTPLNAVFAAGGPSPTGSLRTVRHYRGKLLVQELDVYDLILHGVRGDVQHIQPGDTILIPPVGSQVTLEGMVRRPAIYELRGEKNLSEVLALAGGVLSTGTLRHMDVERIQAHDKRVMLSVDLPEKADAATSAKVLDAFNVQDGDRIRISPILASSEKTVYLDGHVFRPGKYSYQEGMRVSDLVRSYGDLLPEPSQLHAEIIRLNPPDFRPVVIAFNLGEAMAKNPESDYRLQSFDTVRLFSRYDFEDPPQITVTGEVREPGEHVTNGDIHLRDAIYLAGGITRDAALDRAQVYHRADGRVRVISVDLKKALAGDATENVLLGSHDRIVVHRSLARLDPPAVQIQGDVVNPGKYPLGEGMTAAQLVSAAGGFKRSAYTDRADLARAIEQDGKKVVNDHQEIEIAKAFAGDASADVLLKDGDTLSIRQLTGWKDIGSSIAVRGEVVYPSSYGIREGERLSSVIERAGGFRATAYPQGALLYRLSVREVELKVREDIIRRVGDSQNLNFNASSTPEQQAALTQAALQQQQQIISKLKSEPVTGRLVIKIAPDVAKWRNTPADVEVRAGDVIIIPKRPTFVLVQGQVYTPTAITYSPGKNARWYLQRAGGPTNLGDVKKAFVVRADGLVFGQGSGGWWKEDPLSTVLQPGDSVVVPEKLVGGNSIFKGLMDSAQVMSSIAIAARVAASF